MKKYKVIKEAFILLKSRKVGDVIELDNWDYQYNKEYLEPIETAEHINNGELPIVDKTTTNKKKNLNNNPKTEE